MRYPWMNRSCLAGAIAALGVVLFSCGPSKAEQCREILDLIQQSEAQRTLGDYNRAAQQAELQRYQALVDDLGAIRVSNSALRDHRTQLVEAYENLIVSTHRYLEASNADGHLSYTAGDANAEATVNAVQAQKMQAHNRIDLAVGLFYTTCLN